MTPEGPGDADPDSGGTTGEAGSVDAPPRLAPILDALADRGAGALVVAGRARDPAVRYLLSARAPVEDRPTAVAVVPAAASDRAEDGRLAVVAPVDGAARALPESVVRADRGNHPAERLAADLADRGVEGPVLAPPSVPHDAALYVEERFDLASTDALDRARRAKTAGERERIETAQAAAVAGMDRAREVLGEATPSDEGAGGPVLRWNDDVLTAGRLRREVDAAIAGTGADPAGNTLVAAGRAVDRRPRPEDPLRAGDPVVVDLAPRDPGGYHGSLARTYVVEGDVGWERRAHVAVERAAQAARAVLEAGAGSQAGAVHREGAAELAAYGFDPEGEPGLTHRIGHGVGLDPRERPLLRGDDELRPGEVVAVGPSIADDDREVRLRDLYVVREDGADPVAEYPTTIRP